MAGTNDFKAFAIGASANVITQAEYEALATLIANGFLSGIASSEQFNKVWRQSSVISAVIGRLIAEAGNQDALDDEDVDQLLVNLQIGIQRAAAARVDVATAASVDLTAAAVTSGCIRLTGSTGVTEFDVPDGRVVHAVADAAFTITTSTELMVDGYGAAAAVRVGAGDCFTIIGEAESGGDPVARISGLPKPGEQVGYAVNHAVDGAALNTLSVDYAAKYTTSLIEVTALIDVEVDDGDGIKVLALHRDGVEVARQSIEFEEDGTEDMAVFSIPYEVVQGDLTSHTYTVVNVTDIIGPLAGDSAIRVKEIRQ